MSRIRTRKRAHRIRGHPISTLLPLLFLAWTGAAQAQQNVGGTVVDGANQRPLVGAQVVIDGTELGTLTDNRGRFLILNVPGGQVTVRAIMIGYRDATATIDAGTANLVIPMAETALSLDEIVVTGTARRS